jgi:hypothetical protein
MSFAAQGQTITLGQLDCLPLDGNAVLNATVSPEVAGATTRLYFRRLNATVEDFYFVDMVPAGAGGYWATFPRPTDDKLEKKQLKNYSYEGKSITNGGRPAAEWWRAKEGSAGRNPNGDLDNQQITERAAVGKQQKRAWMSSLDDAALQSWLDRQTTEPGEYYVAVVDGAGKQLASSEMRSVEARSECRTSLTPQQQGYAKNLTIGETAAWQAQDEVFHWECEGVVTRKNPNNVLRADDNCRGCIIAWWPVAAAAGAIAAIGVIDDDPVDVSPSQP